MRSSLASVPQARYKHTHTEWSGVKSCSLPAICDGCLLRSGNTLVFILVVDTIHPRRFQVDVGQFL